MFLSTAINFSCILILGHIKHQQGCTFVTGVGDTLTMAVGCHAMIASRLIGDRNLAVGLTHDEHQKSRNSVSIFLC